MPRSHALLLLLLLPFLTSCILDTETTQSRRTIVSTKFSGDTALTISCTGCAERGITRLRLHLSNDSILEAPLDADALASFSLIGAEKANGWVEADSLPLYCDSVWRSGTSTRLRVRPVFDSSARGDTLVRIHILDTAYLPVYLAADASPRISPWNRSESFRASASQDLEHQASFLLPRTLLRVDSTLYHTTAYTTYKGVAHFLVNDWTPLRLPQPWLVDDGNPPSDTTLVLHCTGCLEEGMRTIRFRTWSDSSIDAPLDSTGTARFRFAWNSHPSYQRWFEADSIPLIYDTGWSQDRKTHMRVKAVDWDSSSFGDTLLTGTVSGAYTDSLRFFFNIWASGLNYNLWIDTVLIPDSTGRVSFLLPQQAHLCMRRRDLGFGISSYGLYPNGHIAYSDSANRFVPSGYWP